MQSESADDKWVFTFSWRIEKYLSCCKKLIEKISSPVFTIETLGRSKWHLEIHPTSYEDEYKKYVGIILIRVDDKILVDDVVVCFEIQLKNFSEKILSKASYLAGCDDSGKFESWGWPDFIRIAKLMYEIKTCCQDTLILTCRMKYNEESQSTKRYCEAITRMIVDRCTFRWNVKFLQSSLSWEKGHFFYLDSMMYEIIFSMSQDDATITIRSVAEKSWLPRHVLGSVSLLDPKGNEIVSRKASHSFSFNNEGNTWDFPLFISKKQLPLQMDKKTCPEEGAFDLLCEFSIVDKTEARSTEYRTYDTFSNFDAILELRRGLKQLWSSEKFSDVKLRIDDALLPTHKNILAVRSPVFYAMFELNMVENQTGVIDIDDVEFDTMKSLLEFLYTGSVTDMNYEAASKLLVAADKYQVASLIEKCALFLTSILSMENVCDVLSLADMVNHETLKTDSLNFIIMHNSAIFPTSEWSLWIQKNAKLSAEIFAHLGKNFTVTPKQTSNDTNNTLE